MRYMNMKIPSQKRSLIMKIMFRKMNWLMMPMNLNHMRLG